MKITAPTIGSAIKRLAQTATLLLGAIAPSQSWADVYATFSTGAIAEYSSNNANQNAHSTAFASAPRAIESVTVVQSGETWGGTQGNDYDVSLVIIPCLPQNPKFFVCDDPEVV